MTRVLRESLLTIASSSSSLRWVQQLRLLKSRYEKRGCILRHFQGIHPLLSLITSERGPFRALKRLPLRQEAVHSLWSRLFCGPLKMRSVHQKAFSGTEYPSRTVEACFLHRIASENASRTPGGLFEHGTHIPYRRRLFPVPNFSNDTLCPV